MVKLTGYEKGVNLGGWLSQCGPRYCEEHYNSFIKKEDIETIKSWGLDHVRIPVDYNVVMDEEGNFIESGFKHIDDAISWCEEYGLKIVLDLHKAPGFVFDNAEYCGFFFDEKLQDMFVNLWLEFTKRYGKKKDIAFELLNEVTEMRFAEPWNEISTRTIKAIHEVEPEKIVIIGGIYNSSIEGLRHLPKPVDDYVVYTFHDYSPMVFTHQGASWVKEFTPDYRTKYRIPAEDLWNESKKLFGNSFDLGFIGLKGDMSADFFRNEFKIVFEVKEKWGVDLYCGEYGVIDQADRESALEWYKDINEVLKENNIPRAAWSYKWMNFDLAGDANSELRKYF